jgi:predicted DNA-binding transcriptional regulator AlpA
MHTGTGERHLSPEQLADREGVSVATVYQWNRLGTGPRYMRIGRHARYRFSDVIAWEDARYACPRGPLASGQPVVVPCA